MQTNDIINELSTNFIEYAAAVNTDRSLPDARTGLKPVARRILWAGYDGKYTSNKPYVKCARIVGDVIGKWHPHGDSSVYGALVRLSQPWVMRYPLIDFHGNMGNIDGDGPAAYRYTNARLSKIAELGLLNNLKKKNVDFIANYDENDFEPTTLPSIFPNLLCNPNSGIGVAIACSWLPHNLGEVATAINDYLDGKEPSLPGPDFPTGGVIINQKDIPSIMKTGHGSIKVRGKYTFEKNKIVFYEIPYGQNTENLLAEIGKACDNEEIVGVKNVRNESNKKGLRIVIECKKDVSLDSVVQKLFAKTGLQTSVSYNQVGLVDKTPVELNLKDCIMIYVNHNLSCISKEAKFDLAKAQARLEIVDGLIRALEDIDNIISLIKKSKSSVAAKDNLVKIYKFTDNQAKAIVDMKLGRLAGLEKIELQQEKSDLDKKVIDLKALLLNKSIQIQELRNRLNEIVKKFGDKRRTEITQINASSNEKEIEAVAPEDCVVVMTKGGNIKRVPSKNFKVQKRFGKGVKTQNDTLLNCISTNTVDTLMMFSDQGKMYRLLVDSVPVGTNAAKGTPINNLISLPPEEHIIAITSLYRKSKAEYVVFITKNGLVKKTKIEEYFKTKRNGITAIKIKDGDSISKVTFLNDEELILITKQGIAIRFETNTISPIGRVTSGVKGINLRNDNDEVIAVLPIHNTNDYVGIFTAEGLGKKIELKEFPIQSKGGKGIFVTKNSHEIIGAEMINDEDNIVVIGPTNSICISAKDIPKLSRQSLGNMMIKSTATTVVKL